MTATAQVPNRDSVLNLYALFVHIHTGPPVVELERGEPEGAGPREAGGPGYARGAPCGARARLRRPARPACPCAVLWATPCSVMPPLVARRQYLMS